MREVILIGILVLGYVLYVLIRMNREERLGIDSEEKVLIAKTVVARSDGRERVIPLYAYHDVSIPSKYYKRKNCLYYAMGISDERIYITQFIVNKGELSFERTGIIHKSDLSWIEGTKEYRSQMRFVFNLKNGNKFVWYIDESNVKVDRKCKVNIQQKEEMQAAYEIIGRWMSEVNQYEVLFHPVQSKISKVFYGIAKVSFLIGIIGLITYIATIILSKMEIMYGDIEKYSTMAISLGFFISIFGGLFGLIFEEGSKGYL